MLGAIIGDLAGSIYEYNQVKNCQPVNINNIIEKEAFFSDDTILTIAVLDAIINKVPYEKKLKEYAIRFNSQVPKNTPYFKTMFSPNFSSWAISDKQGESSGNGAMMRISAVGYLFDTEEDIIRESRLATIPSHNTKEAIEAATTIALIIYHSRNGLSKEEIIKKLKLKINKPNITKFNYTCIDTTDVCLYSLFNSNSFEQSIKTVISFGGDTDTNACIVGSMAEAMFGINEELKQKALSKLPIEFIDILKKGYAKINRSVDHIY